MGTSEYWEGKAKYGKGQKCGRLKLRLLFGPAKLWGGPKAKVDISASHWPKKMWFRGSVCGGASAAGWHFPRQSPTVLGPIWRVGAVPLPLSSVQSTILSPSFYTNNFCSIQIERLNRSLPHPIFQSPSNIFWKSLRRGRPKKSRRINKMVNEYLFVWSFNIYKYKVQISLQFI